MLQKGHVFARGGGMLTTVATNAESTLLCVKKERKTHGELDRKLKGVLIFPHTVRMSGDRAFFDSVK